MTFDSFFKKLNDTPDLIEFDDVIQLISTYYQYTPTRFANGPELVNKAGTNEGSCKIFAFAKLHNLTQEQTLACFGKYYRNDVLNHPTGNDHGNIRTFMEYGWTGISFEGSVLKFVE